MNKKYFDMPPRSHPDYLRLWRQTKQSKEKRAQYLKQWYEANKEYVSIESKKQRTNNPKRYRERVWQRHGIVEFSYEDYLVLLKAQNNQCKICLNETSLDVDHDHRTGVVRGLLCKACNKALGFFQDDHGLLEKAIEYLKSSSVTTKQLSLNKVQLRQE
jgi:hypothetical protein